MFWLAPLKTNPGGSSAVTGRSTDTNHTPETNQKIVVTEKAGKFPRHWKNLTWFNIYLLTIRFVGGQAGRRPFV
ncbi:MAG: hypothetical protein CMM01_04610 [Rhodopirellula sp.]|nr:hypothetical protein [Rhodopirellula sp.]